MEKDKERERRRKIRNRKSYRTAQILYDIIADPEIDDCQRLIKIFDLQDKQGGFGSQAAADYAKESLNLFIEDKENGIDDDEPEEEIA